MTIWLIILSPRYRELMAEVPLHNTLQCQMVLCANVIIRLTSTAVELPFHLICYCRNPSRLYFSCPQTQVDAVNPVQTEFFIILMFSTPCELNGCLTASNRFFTHCLSILDTGWQYSCVCALSWSMCAYTWFMCAFAIDLASQINVTWLVWLSILSPCSVLWSWHKTRKGNHHQGIWPTLITALFSEGAGLMYCVKRKAWHIHLVLKNGFCVTHMYKTYHIDSGLWMSFVSRTSVKSSAVLNC